MTDDELKIEALIRLQQGKCDEVAMHFRNIKAIINELKAEPEKIGWAITQYIIDEEELKEEGEKFRKA